MELSVHLYSSPAGLFPTSTPHPVSHSPDSKGVTCLPVPKEKSTFRHTCTTRTSQRLTEYVPSRRTRKRITVNAFT